MFKRLSENQDIFLRRLEWIVFFIVILMVITIRIRLASVPLERDEGEYAYAGQLILQGLPPFHEVRLPGIYAAYALLMAFFGQSSKGIHIGLIFVNIGTVVLLVLLGKKLFDISTGLVAGSTFAVTSLSQSVAGIFAQNEHFILLPAIGGFLTLHHAMDSDRLSPFLYSGLLLGLAFLMKQPGAAFGVFAFLWMGYRFSDRLYNRRENTWFKSIFFLTGLLFPFLFVLFIHVWVGDFDTFRFWKFTYAYKYVSMNPLSEGFKLLVTKIIVMGRSSIFIWGLAVIGCVLLFRNKANRSRFWFVIGFFIFSFFSVCPGFYFRPHYFILLLPAIALLTGTGIGMLKCRLPDSSFRKNHAGLAILLFVASISYLFFTERIFFFQLKPVTACRAVFHANPFPESIEIGKYIRKHSTPEDRIAVLGSEPQIYFYSHRRSASDQMNTYALMENHPAALKMQQKMIDEIETVRPEFLVYVNVSASWLRTPDSKDLIFDWLAPFQRKNYQLVGVVDILYPKNTVYRWDDDAKGYVPRSGRWLAVYRRRA